MSTAIAEQVISRLRPEHAESPLENKSANKSTVNTINREGTARTADRDTYESPPNRTACPTRFRYYRSKEHNHD